MSEDSLLHCSSRLSWTGGIVGRLLCGALVDFFPVSLILDGDVDSIDECSSPVDGATSAEPIVLETTSESPSLFCESRLSKELSDDPSVLVAA